MAYTLTTSLLDVKGVGEKTAQDLAAKGLTTVRDLVLNLPLHYLDRSTLGQIKDLNTETELTFVATVTSTSNFYRRPRSIQSATVKDETGRVKLMWFNNPFILKKLSKGTSYVFSGKLGKNGTIVQAVVAGVGEDSLHTGRIVPVYSGAFGIPVGRLRRIYHEVLGQLEVDQRQDLSHLQPDLEPLAKILQFMHFPEDEVQVVAGKERLALEELLVLIKKSNQIKAEWQKLGQTSQTDMIQVPAATQIPSSVPFPLTTAQRRVVTEILGDLGQPVPMNRLLIGDVGSGKTVVAGIAAYHLAQAGHLTTLVAPTKILAAQHLATLQGLFPELRVELLVARKPIKFKPGEGGIVVGTHRLINQLEALEPSLVIYDEQHRFGVAQRSGGGKKLRRLPHVLTMTATPIPRTLLLTIFSHLSLSIIDELPPGRKPVETFLSTNRKVTDFYAWLKKILSEGSGRQALIVCPFIEASTTEGFAEIKSVEEQFSEVKAYFKDDFVVGKLHSRLKKPVQEQVVKDLFAGQIQILVTTPIVEVGVDLPAATVVAIHNAERFGLASLHQIRGRVGRRDEAGYCVLFSDQKTASTRSRLKMFCGESAGMKLAEFDLKNRGAGDIFGLAQSGDDGLRFANWTNLELISRARQIYNEVENKTWLPLLASEEDTKKALPWAN